MLYSTGKYVLVYLSLYFNCLVKITEIVHTQIRYKY